MTIRERVQTFVLTAGVLTAVGLLGAAPQAPAGASPALSAPLTQQIPFDSLVTVGRLPNGLRYYIRVNKEPVHRAELRLAVNAGSILEEDGQQGLAHFVEHMAFNGTRHFPKQDVVTFMQSIGMRFGAHVNAYTSFDETVYMLQVPTEKPDVLDRSMLILEDWAHDVTFDPAEIDKERGVVMEEWRLGRGAASRIQDKQFPILLQGSRYAERIPIGKTDVLQHFKPQQLTRFYNDWYRPDLMAVVAVGDFDKTAMETLIKTHFGHLANPASPRPRPSFDVPEHAGTTYTIATDKEATSTVVSVYNITPFKEPGTVGGYRQEIVDHLFSAMLSSRLAELSQRQDSPFLGAGASRGLFVRTAEAATLGALVQDGGVDRGLDALFGEAERVTRFGFTSTELEREKQDLLRTYERLLAQKDQHESGTLAAEYLRNFLQKETVPGIAYEYALHQRFLPDITLAEVNALAKAWFPDKNRVVVVSAPQKDGVAVPDAAELANVIKSAATKPLTPYVDSSDTAPLIDTPPAPGAIAKTSTRDAIGITEWELSNGVKVVLKPTSFKEDEILFRGFRPGGTSLASDQDFVAAETAAQVVSAGGLGHFSASDVRRMLTGKVASVRPFIGDLDEGVSGGASPKDLELMFQQIYLTFTQPRADPAIFGVMTSQLKSLMANQAATPEFAFGEAREALLTQNHFRARSMTPAIIDEMSLEKSFAFYKDRFADASGFTFVFVGSLDPATMRPLVERYLGSLPALHKAETWKDVGMRTPTGVLEKRVEKGIEPKSRASLVFTGPFQYDQAHRVAIRAMSDVLQTRLLETIREELGGTYSITVSPSYDRIPTQTFEVSIDFGCDPQRTDDLVKRVFQEIERLKTSGPTAQQVSDVKAALQRDFETNVTQNGYLLGQIAQKYAFSEDPATLLAVPDFYRKIDAATIQDAARTYLDGRNVVKVTLFPEKK